MFTGELRSEERKGREKFAVWKGDRNRTTQIREKQQQRKVAIKHGNNADREKELSEKER